MKERKAVYKVLQAIEDIFPDTIAYAYLDSNSTKTHVWWNVCIDNWDLYYSKDFKEFTAEVHKRYKPHGIKLLFCYCYPLEKKLLELAEQDNLILNIKE